MKLRKISYARGFPYGAPLAMVRGGATRDADVKEFLRGVGFRWDGSRYAWSHYMDRSEFGSVLRYLRDTLNCEVGPKSGMDAAYEIDLDSDDFSRPNHGKETP